MAPNFFAMSQYYDYTDMHVNMRHIVQAGDTVTETTAWVRKRKTCEGKVWSVDEEQRLYDGFSQWAEIRGLSTLHGRTRGAIRCRLKVLGLLDDMGEVVSPKPSFSPSRMSLSRATTRRRVPTSNKVAVWSDLLFLKLFRQLPIERHAIVFEVMRGLVALNKPELPDAVALNKLPLD